MNVQASRDLREIAALYATGEISRYEELVAGAAAAATELEFWRDQALGVGGELLEIADTVYGYGPGGTAPAELGAAYTGLTGLTLESAAGEFLNLANWATENDELPGAPAPSCYGYAALYLAGEATRYELARAEIDDCIQTLRALAARAIKYGAAAAATDPSATEPLTGGRAECLANSVYDRVAAEIEAAIGGYTVAVPESVR